MRLPLLAIICLNGFCLSFAAESPVQIKSAVERFVSSRAAGSVDEFAAAARQVRALAEAGQPFFRFLLAVYSEQEPLCELPAKTRARYLSEGRPLLLRHAEEGNALAQYLLGVDCQSCMNRPADARDWFEQSAGQDQPLALNSLGLLYYHGAGVT